MYYIIYNTVGVARGETDSTIEKGVMGVGKGSVCASVQCMGVGEGVGVRLTSRVGLFVNSYFGLSGVFFLFFFN